MLAIARGIAASTAVTAALEAGEAPTAARLPEAATADYAHDDAEDDQGADNNNRNGRPSIDKRLGLRLKGGC